jgi:TonB family protein
MGIARLFVVSPPPKDLSVREIEIVNFDPPPPPEAIEEPPPDAPPPPPSLTNLSEIPDPTRIAMPTADVPMDITLPVEDFFVDAAPSPLPTAAMERAPSITKPAIISRPKAPPVVKSHYSTSELDEEPKLLRHGSATFPAKLARQGIKRGKVVLDIELSTTGTVKILSIISSSHPELISQARRVAAGARFTPPKRNGQPVKGTRRWSVVIQQ